MICLKLSEGGRRPPQQSARQLKGRKNEAPKRRNEATESEFRSLGRSTNILSFFKFIIFNILLITGFFLQFL